MRTRVAIAVAALLVAGAVPATAGSAAAAQEDCSFPVSMVDATGAEVTVEAEPRRVVTLAPSAAQTMWEIGAKDKVVGVSKYATYLEGAAEKANVSGGGRSFASVEKVVAAEPDLVLAPNVISNDTVRTLRDAGLTVYKFRQADSIEFVYEKTRLVGRLVGECEGAAATVEHMRARIDTVREAVEGEERPNVLYVFFGYTAGANTFIHEIIETAGGNNVAAEAGIRGYRQLNPEIVANRTVEWIVLNSDSPSVPQGVPYNGTVAVQEGNVVVLNANYISQPAPRIVRPIVKLAKALHPEAYAAANATPTATPTPSPTPSPTDTPTSAVDEDGETDTPTPTEAPAAPGFGPVAAIVAVLLLALLARRR